MNLLCVPSDNFTKYPALILNTEFAVPGILPSTNVFMTIESSSYRLELVERHGFLIAHSDV